jgi:hypothetical protein
VSVEAVAVHTAEGFGWLAVLALSFQAGIEERVDSQGHKVHVQCVESP